MTRSSIRTRAKLVEPGEADLVFRKRRFEMKRAGVRPPEGIQTAEAKLDPPPAEPSAFQLTVRPIADYEDFLRGAAARGFDGGADSEDAEGELDL
jgi:hypothetical protein